MYNLFFGVLLGLITSPQPILPNSVSAENTYYALRVDHGTKILLPHGINLYKVYAARCNEIVDKTQRLDYIILYPGEPIELIDKNNIIILYSLPCN